VVTEFPELLFPELPSTDPRRERFRVVRASRLELGDEILEAFPTSELGLLFHWSMTFMVTMNPPSLVSKETQAFPMPILYVGL